MGLIFSKLSSNPYDKPKQTLSEKIPPSLQNNDDSINIVDKSDLSIDKEIPDSSIQNSNLIQDLKPFFPRGIYNIGNSCYMYDAFFIY